MSIYKNIDPAERAALSAIINVQQDLERASSLGRLSEEQAERIADQLETLENQLITSVLTLKELKLELFTALS